MQYQILHIEDSKTDADLVKRLIQKSGLNFSYHLASDKKEVMEAFEIFEPNIILCDHSLPSFNSEMAYNHCKEKDPNLPFILVTGTVSEEFAVEMLKIGVDDYLLKSNLQRLPMAIENALRKKESHKKVETIQKELRQSETHLRTIFDNSSNGLILLDSNCVILELNERTKYYNNISFGSELKKNDNLLETIPPFRKKELQSKFKQTLLGKKIQYESVYPQQDGSVITFDVKLNPTISAEGTVTGACLTFEDITERKKVEHELEESEIINRSILESIDYHIALVEPNGDIISVNKAWNEFSINNGEAVLEKTGIGSNYISICKKAAEAGEALGTNALQGFHKVLNKEIPFFEMEYPCHSADEQRWFLLRMVNFADQSPKVVMMHINISELKKSVSELKESEQRYSNLFHLSPQPKWVIDLETSGFLDVNEAALKIYMYSREEFLGMRLDDLIVHQTSGESTECIPVPQHYDQGTIEMHRKKNGEIMYVNKESRLIYYKNKKAALGLSIDVTERVKHIAAIEMQNKKLREIAWTQSHIVRAPLARMMGIVDLIRNLKNVSIEYPEWVDHFTASAIELDNIIRDITSKSQITPIS